jgi:biopolymer transport protein ExbB
MRGRLLPWLFFCGFLFSVVSPAWGQDIREASRKAALERTEAREEAREAEERILKDRKALRVQVQKLESRQRALEEEVRELEASIATNREEEAGLSAAWAEKELAFREIVGSVRISARDLETIFRHSPFTALAPERPEKLRPLLDKKYFPGIEDIRLLADFYLDEAKRSGEVSLREGTFVDRTGADRAGKLLMLGKFTAVYNDGEETGFLSYSEDGRRFRALSALPSWYTRRNLERYVHGNEEAVYLDLSGGAALRQITHKPSLMDQIQSGGPIVWPILGLALLALILVVERFVYLNRVHGNTDRLMENMNRMAENGEWGRCEELVRKHEGRERPVINVLAAGLASRSEDRETQENILQEAILREAPRLERFLSVLGILGAIAPLLGLLGTVTGMIATFRVITLYGTGDPRMMSGGISEALITTELGLAVAIPIMLLHTLLSRRVDHIIGEMEEKAVALTNIMQKARAENGPLP